MKAVVLTISDSVTAGTRVDRSGPAAKARLEELGWAVELEVLADDAGSIAARLSAIADEERASLVVTTGGTGLAPRDVTPEATRRVLEREVPGIPEQIRAVGRLRTPTAILSRGLAGVRRRTLIINLPGSPGGALDSLNAIIEVVPHLIDLLHGRTDHGAAAKLPAAR